MCRLEVFHCDVRISMAGVIPPVAGDALLFKEGFDQLDATKSATAGWQRYSGLGLPKPKQECEELKNASQSPS